MEHKIILPYAPVLVESTRSIGYSFEAALSDIIDNSITSNGYKVNSEVIKIVSNHTMDLSGLIDVIEEKSKWLIIKDADVMEVPAKEEMITNARINMEQDENEYDSPEFYRLSRYESAKMIAQIILVAKDMGKLNYLNFPELISDLLKWGGNCTVF